ncbi:MAG TPA: hypothetical protein VFR87_20785 [Nocardioidaceae bacterium]|nr:hypothetical protein [Nocardioidaceae bacterium]
MTDLLRDTLREQADAQTPPRFDVGAIVRAGEQRARRSRLTTGLVAAGVTGIVAAGSLTLPGLLATDNHRTAAPPPPYAERKVSFAVGDVIHWGKESFSVGDTVSSYVQTDDGFVYTTGDGSVWFYDGASSERVGRSTNRTLRADDTGSLVAWVARAADGHPQYVVFDTHTRAEAARVDDDAAGPSRDPADQGAEVFALDDGAAYWRAEGSVVRYDIESGETEVLRRTAPVTDPANKPQQVIQVTDVAHGQIAFVTDDNNGSRLLVGPAMDDTARTMPTGWNAALSPDATYVAVEEADEIAVYERASVEAVTPGLDDYPFKSVYGWVDDDTAMVFGIRSLKRVPYPADFLTCDIATGQCQVVASAEVGGSASFALPVGDPLDS